MLFIGTSNKLDEIHFNEEKPDFFIEMISGELNAISDKFEHKNVYLVGTSRGCSCDFGIKTNPITEFKTEQRSRILDWIRKLIGVQDRYIKRQISNRRKLAEQEHLFHEQSLKLIAILKANTSDLNLTEAYCCWAGEYSKPATYHKTINISKEKIEDYFEMELDEKVKFISNDEETIVN
jgi:hypothetical protein